MTFDALRRFLEEEAAERLFHTGGQVYASVDGEVLFEVAVGVDGTGMPVDSSTLFAIYCAGKPAFAVALATLVDDRELSFDDRLGDIVELPLRPETARLTIRSLLDHTAGLHQFDAHTYLGLPRRQQLSDVLGMAPPLGWRPGVDLAYGQVAPWDLLGLAVEALTGEPVRDTVRHRVLVPSDVVGDVFIAGMAEDDYDRVRSRLGVNAYLFDQICDPILAERTRRMRCLPNPAFGNSATATGLGRFYEALLDVFSGKSSLVDPMTLSEITRTHQSGMDRVLRRDCSYGLGVMTELSSHEFGGRPSGAAFGHSAFGGVTAAFCDPECGLVVATHFTGRIDGRSAIEYRRPALMDRIYRLAVDRT